MCSSWVWIQTKLDGTKYCYQVIKTMTKFEKKTRHRLYVFIKKKTINLAICNTCYALDARRETQAGSPQDHMATDSWEGNKGDGEDLGGHQVHGKGSPDVEGTRCCPTCLLGVKDMREREMQDNSAHMTRSVHLHRHDVLTVLLHCPITSRTCTPSY